MPATRSTSNGREKKDCVTSSPDDSKKVKHPTLSPTDPVVSESMPNNPQEFVYTLKLFPLNETDQYSLVSSGRLIYTFEANGAKKTKKATFQRRSLNAYGRFIQKNGILVEKSSTTLVIIVAVCCLVKYILICISGRSDRIGLVIVFGALLFTLVYGYFTVIEAIRDAYYAPISVQSDRGAELGCTNEGQAKSVSASGISSIRKFILVHMRRVKWLGVFLQLCSIVYVVMSFVKFHCKFI